MRAQNFILVVVSIVTATILTIVAVFMLSFYLKDNLNRTEFNQQVWVNWQETESTLHVRWDMVHNLLDEHEFIGLTEEEVTEFLGQPDFKDNHRIAYNLGSTREGINYGILRFKMEDNKVSECGYHSH